MKKLGLLVVLLLIGLSAWIYHQELKSPYPMPLDKRASEAKTSIVYELEKEKWTVFNLPPNTPGLKIVTHANLPVHLQLIPDERLKYALEYQLLDKNNRVLQTRDYHFTATVKFYKDPRFKKPITASFYYDPNIIPSDGKVLKLNLEGMPAVARFRVRVKSKDPVLQGILIRVYAANISPLPNYPLQWRRLNQAQQERLARGNIYPSYLLTEEEIANLLKDQYLPVGPAGIEGEDYKSYKLYIANQQHMEPVPSDILPVGLLVDDVLRGVIPLPKGENMIRLQFSSAKQGNDPPKGSTIIIRWRGRTLFESRQFKVEWSGNKVEWQHRLPLGELEIIAPGQLIVRAWVVNGKPVEITPEPLYLRTYTAFRNNPVQYSINHPNNQPALFRVDFRLLIPFNISKLTLPKVQYALLDQNKKTIARGLLSINPGEFGELLSHYERLDDQPFSSRVSSTVSYYFVLQPEIKFIKFLANEPVLLRAYNRPYNMVRKIKVPEAYYYHLQPELRQPAWFFLKPDNEDDLLLNKRSILLVTQKEPEELNPEALAGNYRWEDFHPQGTSLGKLILTPITYFRALRKEALSQVYQKIPVNHTVGIELNGEAGERNINPYLAYIRNDSTPAVVKLLIDGCMHYQGLIPGASGEILLPAINTGKHQIHIQSDKGTVFYLNHTSTTKGDYLKRLVNYLDKDGLTFNYEKISRDEETLSFRFYVPYEAVGRNKISIEIQAVRSLKNPLRYWSLLNREFDIEPNKASKIPVFFMPQQNLDKGQLLTVPVGEDVEPGTYTVNVKLLKGTPGYLIFSRLIPGEYSLDKIFMEKEGGRCANSM
ncbi:hypothetical protein [Legionella londiniensis]|uniref:Uncharacterized protein n=1 Tax=Legionella londiniensis TaxID=45068 RepID=A0A0W0VNE9_9GAMM|nr:hypothetical protein [Legionella londiniensis]KTD21685.1 hypothetical protein Llon_0850 [Legionella londiniensis]STX93480.1 Uncharacterised protein [Legionella londiniensis]